MKRLLIVTAIASAALAGPAAADDPVSFVTGGGVGSGVVATDQLELAVTQSATGIAGGHVQNEFALASSSFNLGGSPTCVRIAGNRAVVVYRFPAPVTVSELPGEVFPYGAAYIEDNGDPVAGQPVDKMVDFAVREINIPFFCDADPLTFFAAPLAEPLSSGNFVIGNR